MTMIVVVVVKVQRRHCYSLSEPSNKIGTIQRRHYYCNVDGDDKTLDMTLKMCQLNRMYILVIASSVMMSVTAIMVDDMR